MAKTTQPQNMNLDLLKLHTYILNPLCLSVSLSCLAGFMGSLCACPHLVSLRCQLNVEEDGCARVPTAIRAIGSSPQQPRMPEMQQGGCCVRGHFFKQ
jgi:hypothetical protein